MFDLARPPEDERDLQGHIGQLIAVVKEVIVLRRTPAVGGHHNWVSSMTPTR